MIYPVDSAIHRLNNWGQVNRQTIHIIIVVNIVMDSLLINCMILKLHSSVSVLMLLKHLRSQYMYKYMSSYDTI